MKLRQNDCASHTLAGSVTITTGAPQFDVRLILPAQVGRSVPATSNVDDLFGFELLQAMSGSPLGSLVNSTDVNLPSPGLSIAFTRSFGSSINERYRLGPFGRGWNATTVQSLEEQPDGTVIVHESPDLQRLFQPDRRTSNSYFGQVGETGKLRKLPGVGFELTELDGTVTQFHVDGKLNFERDTRGNTISAGYNAGRLSALTHSSGASISLAYNTAGRITSLTDSFGRVTTYAYDATNEHLLTVTDVAGTTTFTYAHSQGAAREHALTSVTDPSGVTRFFDYDVRGRLTDTYRTGT